MDNANLSYSQLIAGTEGAPDTVGNSDATPQVKPAASGDEEQRLVAYVNHFYTTRRAQRRPLEATWAVNAALIRGIQRTRWNPVFNMLEATKAPKHRSNDNLNIILPKVKAKLSKFLKSRVIPVVRAASTDHEDILNAEATTKVLEYLWDKLQLEEKYEEALLWAMQTGKSFWWFYWNQTALAQVKEPAGFLKKEQIHDIPLGEPGVEMGSAFEVLPSDMGITRVANQPELMRVKARKAADAEQQFGLPKGSLPAELKESELFQYQRQIAQLGARNAVGISVAGEDKRDDEENTHVVVKELFTAPCASYPNGRYVVVVGSKLVHNEQELPYGLANRTNPYPVIEFSDTITAGQFWPTTMTEQLQPVQSQYNRLRNRVDEQLKQHTHPKVFIPIQAKMHPNAWNSEAGEKIPINWQPGMPPPSQWVITPPNIAGDVWRTIDILRAERDEISNLYPAAMGNSGGESGFDTNLLQEAADSVHAPDIRRNELALRDGAYILRRLAKLGFDVPRLITIVGRDKQPEVFEFSSEQIDEHANIVIEAGSALPQQKHARIEAILKMDERQLFGPPGDPQRNRTVQRMMQLGMEDEADSLGQRDENRARLENLAFTRNQPVEDPMPWENHDIEYEIHTDLLKSHQIKSWPKEQRAALVRHTILHVKWKNPQMALQLAAVFGMMDVVQEIQQTMLIEQQFAQPPAAPQGAPQGEQPQGGEQPAQPEAPQPPQAPQTA